MKYCCSVLLLSTLIACGGNEPEPVAPQPTTTQPAPEPAPAPTASAPAADTSAMLRQDTPPAPEPQVLSFTRSSEYGKVDKMGVKDGVLKGDGKKDAVFTAKVKGPIEALFVVSIDPKDNEPSGAYDADTLIAGQLHPNELAHAAASKKPMPLAVYEGTTMLNKEDGSLKLIDEKEHELTLYAPDDASIRAGKIVRLYVISPDHHVAHSENLK